MVGGGGGDADVIDGVATHRTPQQVRRNYFILFFIFFLAGNAISESVDAVPISSHHNWGTTGKESRVYRANSPPL